MTANFDCYDHSTLGLRSQNLSEVELHNLTHPRSQPSPSESDARSSISQSTSTIFPPYTHMQVSQPPIEDGRASLDDTPSDHLAESIHSTIIASQPPPSSVRVFCYLAHVWKWELFTWLLGTAGLLANIILLMRFNGVQQEYWKSNVQITAFVAALAQLSQSALLVPIASSIGQSKWGWLQKERRAADIEKFDLASRGPDGALRLLWHLKLRPNLVSLGALSTIMMLAFPTFVQQSVAVNTRLVESHAGSPTYVKRAGRVSVTGLQSFNFDDDTSNSVAMFQALVTEYINPANVTGHCTTDFCTWEPYTTLSMCVTTDDISESLKTGNTVKDNATLPPIPLGHDHPSSVEPGTTLYTYTQSVGYLYEHWPLPALPDNDTPISLPNYPNLYMAFYDPCKQVVQGEQRPFDAQDITRWTAFRAAFRPCVQVFDTTYESSWRSHTGTLVPESLQWYITKSARFCTQGPSYDDEMCISSNLLYAISESLRATYSFSGKRGLVKEKGELKVKEDLGSYAPAWSSTLLQDIRSNLGNTDECNEEAFRRFDKRVQNMAASVSIEIRNSEDSPGFTVKGTAWVTRKQMSHLPDAWALNTSTNSCLPPEPTIEVNFTWLTMPIILYFGLTAFFFTTMVTTATAPPWKSSPLALLKCANPNNRMATAKQFKLFAESTNVRLEDNGETWHLVDATPLDSLSADKGHTPNSIGHKRWWIV
jgi:hypothetical protein